MQEIDKLPRKLKKRLKREVAETFLNIINEKHIRITHIDKDYKVIKNACAFRIV